MGLCQQRNITNNLLHPKVYRLYKDIEYPRNQFCTPFHPLNPSIPSIWMENKNPTGSSLGDQLLEKRLSLVFTLSRKLSVCVSTGPLGVGWGWGIVQGWFVWRKNIFHLHFWRIPCECSSYPFYSTWTVMYADRVFCWTLLTEAQQMTVTCSPFYPLINTNANINTNTNTEITRPHRWNVMLFNRGIRGIY